MVRKIEGWFCRDVADSSKAWDVERQRRREWRDPTSCSSGSGRSSLRKDEAVHSVTRDTPLAAGSNARKSSQCYFIPGQTSSGTVDLGPMPLFPATWIRPLAPLPASLRFLPVTSIQYGRG